MDPVLAPFILALLAAIGGAVRAYLKTVLTPQRLTTLLDMARAAIAGAEELGHALDLPSEEKYAYAENALRAMAKRLGLRLTDDELNAYIHALLHQQHETERAFEDNEKLLTIYDEYAKSTAAPDEVSA
jgi:hypothetical protein